MTLTPEEHRKRHVELHNALDELLADFIGHTKALPSKTSLTEFLHWSYEQTIIPTEAEQVANDKDT